MHWSCVATRRLLHAGPVSGDIDDRVDLPMDETLTYTAVCTIDPEPPVRFQRPPPSRRPGVRTTTTPTTTAKPMRTLLPRGRPTITVDNGRPTVGLGTQSPIPSWLPIRAEHGPLGRPSRHRFRPI